MFRFVLISLALASASFVGAGEAAAQVSSTFGVRADPFTGKARMHAGYDMPGRMGTPIYATGDGYVRRARVAGGYGNLVELEHGFGYQSRYGHLSRILVQEGQFVRRGQMIGLMGSTGRSTGSHLHYEVRVNGSAVPPGRFMQIVFSTQPDWNQVRLAAMRVQEPATYPPVQRTASIAMIAAAPRGTVGRVKGSGEIRFDAKQPQAATSSFSAGHVAYSK